MEFYGTLGPACQREEILQGMFAAGMTGARVNLSHGGLRERQELLALYHTAALTAGVRRPRLVIDLQGPELRIGSLPHPIQLFVGDTVFLGCNDVSSIPFPAVALAALTPGQEISLDDSALLLTADCPAGDGWACVVERGGWLYSRKSAALTGLALDNLPALTDADRDNLSLARACGVTDILQPFVRGRADLDALRGALAANDLDDVRIMAKIENQRGLEHLDEIIAGCDEVCIARGDLGNGMPLWELPRVQKAIAARCRAAGRPFMVVTQLLHSMEQRPVPTRAEVSDIYNAVLDGASSLMLTGETAAGSYPVEAMKYLVKTARTAMVSG